MLARGAASAQLYNSPGRMHPGGSTAAAAAAAAAARYGSAPAAYYGSPHPSVGSGGYYAPTHAAAHINEATVPLSAAGGLGDPLLAAAMAGVRCLVFVPQA
jgi:hypothetical protein